MKAVGFILAAALVFGSGCAQTDWIDRTLVTVDVTGVWNMIVVARPGTPATASEGALELQQQGPNVTGYWRTGTVNAGPIVGTVAGDVFKFNNNRGSSGEMRVSGDEMTGLLSGQYGVRPVSLRRVNPAPQPSPPTR
jgi:hypothetical protein